MQDKAASSIDMSYFSPSFSFKKAERRKHGVPQNSRY